MYCSLLVQQCGELLEPAHSEGVRRFCNDGSFSCTINVPAHTHGLHLTNTARDRRLINRFKNRYLFNMYRKSLGIERMLYDGRSFPA